MELEEFLEYVNQGKVVEAGSKHLDFMFQASNDAFRVLDKLNNRFCTPQERVALLSELTGRQVDESVTLFPPFYSEFGKNIHFGKRIFINMCVKMQDTGGITIGDGTMIGHGCTLTTLNHAIDPAKRGDIEPKPVVIGRNVWLGAGVTVCPGVTIGEGSVVGAGAVVTRDVLPHTIVGGVPAILIRPTGFGS